MGDLRLVDEVEDVAPRRIEGLGLADRALPRRGVAFAVPRFVLVVPAGDVASERERWGRLIRGAPVSYPVVKVKSPEIVS
jgi:hypothetical protein